jgi:RNA polymerase sigma-70 factor (ECF subfamily)
LVEQWDGTPGARDRDTTFERDALPWLDEVFRFARSLARDAALAEDIVQETFLRAFRSWHTFQPGSNCRRWLFTICRNVFLRTRERQRAQVELDDGGEESLAAAQLHAEMIVDGTDRLLAAMDLGPAIQRALDRLDEPFRSTVILVDVQDQSYEGASEILGVPVGTVRSRLFRGRRQLQEMLRVYAQDAGFTVATDGGV